MNSVYGRILLWSVAILMASIIALTAISVSISLQQRAQESGPGRSNSLFFEQAIHAYQAGGPEQLRSELARIERYMEDRRYLTDAQGNDLATGENRSGLIADAHKGLPPIPFLIAPRISVFRSKDQKYRFVVVYHNTVDVRPILPFHALFLVAVAVVCGALAANLASPLRQLARSVDRFGAGDLSVRVNSKRKDEIGDVGRAFDRMADRISTLLTAERRLLQDISHELRSPLARLSFAAELTRTAPDRDAAVARLNKEIARLASLVSGLIQVTRAEGDPSARETELIDIRGLIGEVIGDCRVEAEQRDCTIAWRSGAAVWLYGDRELLRRAVENVLRNAIRYTPAGSAIEAELTPEDGMARLSVRDYGPGIPEEAVQKIFQPFFRIDHSRDAATGGVGLGLAIAHRAVTLHHGKLWAENANPGLRVWIELPVYQDASVPR